MTVFMSYIRPFLSEYREEMVNKKWLAEVRSCDCSHVVHGAIPIRVQGGNGQQEMASRGKVM